MATLIKTVKLTLDATTVECQLSRMEITDEPTTEDVVTFCGTDTFATPNYKLNLGGFQDWGAVEGVCDMIHDSYAADPVAEIDFVATVGTATRTGTCKPTQDVPFGGTAGGALTFEIVLDIDGVPVEGVVTP
jgi:hypothetical protein